MTGFVSECFLIPGKHIPPNPICWYGVPVPRILQDQIGSLLLQFMEHVNTIPGYICSVEKRTTPGVYITPWWCLVRKINYCKKNIMRFSEAIYNPSKNIVHISVQFCQKYFNEGPQLLLDVMKFLENKAHEKKTIEMISSPPILLPSTQWWPHQFDSFSTAVITCSAKAATAAVAASAAAEAAIAAVEAAAVVAKAVTSITEIIISISMEASETQVSAVISTEAFIDASEAATAAATAAASTATAVIIAATAATEASAAASIATAAIVAAISAATASSSESENAAIS